jgi:hypothetical protein
VLFGGDRQAYARSGNVFLLERWFDNLSQALGKSEFIVIDHRLNGQDVPTLDLRDLARLPPVQSAPLTPSTPPPSSNEQGQPGIPLRDDDDD